MTKLPIAKKSLGQNFLVNPGVVERIIASAELKPDSTVVEVGPGTGILTAELAKKAKRVIAIEKDHELVILLKEKFKKSNVEIKGADVLKFKIANLGLQIGDYTVIANLPYYITSHFLRLLLETWPRPERAVLMVQKEVAQRMMARPPDMNLLALSVQYSASVEHVMRVSKGSFRPMPTVDSAVVKITPHTQPPGDNPLNIARMAFAGKRKMLTTTLGALYSKEKVAHVLAAIGRAATARPEELSVEEWIDLVHHLL